MSAQAGVGLVVSPNVDDCAPPPSRSHWEEGLASIGKASGAISVYCAGVRT